jgi:hypothetical protein
LDIPIDGDLIPQTALQRLDDIKLPLKNWGFFKIRNLKILQCFIVLYPGSHHGRAFVLINIQDTTERLRLRVHPLQIHDSVISVNLP